MANTPDNKIRPDVTLDSEVQKKMQAEGAIKLKTPAEFKESMSDAEKETLDYFRSKDIDFWKRVGHYEKSIKAKAKEELQDPATGLLKQMRDLNSSTASRLRFFSRKNAERFAEITSRINVTSRTLSAIRKTRILTRNIAATQRAGNEACRQQILKDHPWTGKLYLLRNALVPSDITLTRPPSLDLEKLERAATNVQQKEMAKRAEWEAKIAKRYPIRGTESALREIILEQNPKAIDEIDQALREHASGKSSSQLNDLIDNLPNKNNIDAGTFNQVKNDLKRWANNLKARSGQASKAFELAGRLELIGGAYERVQQIQRSLPVGTRFKVKGKFTATEQEMVLEAKKPANYLVFKKVGTDEYFAVNTAQRAAWSYVVHSPAEEGRYKFQEVEKKVMDAVKINGITDETVLKEVKTELETVFFSQYGSSKNADAVVKAVSGKLPNVDPSKFPQAKKDAIEKAIKDSCADGLKATQPTPKGYAQETEFDHLEFEYA